MTRARESKKGEIDAEKRGFAQSLAGSATKARDGEDDVFLGGVSVYARPIANPVVSPRARNSLRQ